MNRLLFGMMVFMTSALLVASQAVSQPPEGKEDKGKLKDGPPRYKLGKVFPPPLLDELELTPEQEKELDAIEKELKTKLEKLLRKEQKKKVEDFRPRGPGGRGGPGRKGGDRPDRPPLSELAPEPARPDGPGARLITKGQIKVVGSGKSPFTLTGDAVAGLLGDLRQEHSGTGIRLLSGVDLNKDGAKAGSMACTVTGLSAEKGRWFRVYLRAPQENFAVKNDDLFVNVEFFKDDGKNPLDHIRKSLYGQVELERKSLADRGTNKNLGSATWRNYSIDVRTPFPEVDTLRVTVGFGNGVGKQMRPSSGSPKLT